MQTGPAAKTVAANLRRLRGARGISTNQLSALLTKIDHPIAQSSISNIEAGRRRVDVDDLVALAAALDVSPVTLLLPASDPGDRVPIVGKIKAGWEHAWRWMHGETSLTGMTAMRNETFLNQNRPYQGTPMQETKWFLSLRDIEPPFLLTAWRRDDRSEVEVSMWAGVAAENKHDDLHGLPRKTEGE